MAQKTLDGLRITKVLKALEEIGATIREGTNHPYIASIEGYEKVCPIAGSTNARTMIVPWIKQKTSYDTQTIYQALRRGRWNL